MEFDVITWSYLGLDHQRWFWDERNLRSEKSPKKLLDMKLNGAHNRDSKRYMLLITMEDCRKIGDIFPVSLYQIVKIES